MNLARKYRPLTFSQVVGQTIATRVLKNAIKINKIGRDITAILFSGQRGIGKTTLARIVAKALNCEKGVTEEPCNACENCMSISEGKNMDVLEIDGASNRGIDEIRTLRENVKLVPVKSRYKVIIIDEVHMLTQEAFNALLKTLEEPPPNVIFIFATTEPQRIPDTIVSRTLYFELFPIKQEEIAERLKEVAKEENIKIDDDAINRIADASEGSLRDALTLLEKAHIYSSEKITLKEVNEIIGFVEKEIYDDIFQKVVKSDLSAILEKMKEISMQGITEINFIRGFQEYLNDLLKKCVFGEKSLPANLKELDIVRMIKILLDAENVLRWVSNPRIYLEFVLARLCFIPRSIEVEKILNAFETRELPEVKEPKKVEVVEEKEEDRNEWGEFLEEIKKINGTLFLIFENIKPRFKENEIVIEVNSSVYNMMENKKDFIEEKLKEIYGREVRLNIVVQTKETKKSEARENLEKTFELELFGTDESKG